MASGIDIIARGLGARGLAEGLRANHRLDVLPNGLVYIGAVDYYDDLPNDAAVGSVYTVKYKGSSGYITDGSEYVYGEYGGENQWIKLGPEFPNLDSLMAYTEVHDINVNIQNGTASGAEFVEATVFPTTVTITADSGYVLPDEITVNDQTGSSGSVGVVWSYDSSTGDIDLSNASGPIDIIVVCETEEPVSCELIPLDLGHTYDSVKVCATNATREIDNIINSAGLGETHVFDQDGIFACDIMASEEFKALAVVTHPTFFEHESDIVLDLVYYISVAPSGYAPGWYIGRNIPIDDMQDLSKFTPLSGSVVLTAWSNIRLVSDDIYDMEIFDALNGIIFGAMGEVLVPLEQNQEISQIVINPNAVPSGYSSMSDYVDANIQGSEYVILTSSSAGGTGAVSLQVFEDIRIVAFNYVVDGTLVYYSQSPMDGIPAGWLYFPGGIESMVQITDNYSINALRGSARIVSVGPEFGPLNETVFGAIVAE